MTIFPASLSRPLSATLIRLLDPAMQVIVRKIRAFEQLPSDQQHAWQLLRLNEILDYSKRHVPYYKMLANRYPSVSNLRDLQNLPIIYPGDVRNAHQSFVSSEMEVSQYKKIFTSGSSGVPQIVYLDRNAVKRKEAYLHEQYTRFGYTPGDRIALLWGARRRSADPFLERLFRFASNTLELRTYQLDESKRDIFLDALRRFSPQYIVSYASAITALANNLAGVCDIRPKAIQTTSEMLLPLQRRIIERVFNAPVFDKYGANEVGPIAQECDAKCGLHINTHGLIVECIDGNVIVTNLYNKAMPLIRFALGDVATLTTDRCSCGRTTPRLTSLLGRRNDMIRTKDRSYIDPYFFINLLSKSTSIKRFRVFQSEDFTVRFFLEQESLDGDFHAEIRRAMREIAPDLEIRILQLVNDAVTEEKYRYIRSEVRFE